MSSGKNRRGARNGASKLTAENVRDIRRRYIPGTGRHHAVEGNAGQLAREFGLNRRTITAIVNGETWGWLE